MHNYIDVKTNTVYIIGHKDYAESNNTKYLYLKKTKGENGNGPEELQFSVDFFEKLILRGEFKEQK